MARTRLHDRFRKVYSLRKATDTVLHDFTPYPILKPWVRNPSWSTLPLISNQNDICVLLYGVEDTTENFLRIIARVTNGADYQVDWGDGTVTTHADNTYADHAYDYNNANLANTNAPVTFGSNLVTRNNHGYTNGMRISFYTSTVSDVEKHVNYHVVNATTNTFQLALTADGAPITIGSGSGTILPYKQAIIRVTPVVGEGLTEFNLLGQHPSTYAHYAHNALDIECSFPNATSPPNWGNEYNQRPWIIERIKIHTLGSSLTTIRELFRQMKNLEKVEFDFSSLPVLDNSLPMYYTFDNCESLETIPYLDITIGGTSPSTHRAFFQCKRLKEIPDINSFTSDNVSQMFYQLESVKRIPSKYYENISPGTVYNFTQLCKNLIETPSIDISNASTFTALLQSCHRLTKGQYYNMSTSIADNATSFYSSAINITKIPTPYFGSNIRYLDNFYNNACGVDETEIINTSSVISATVVYYNSCVRKIRGTLDFTSVTSLQNFVGYRNYYTHEIGTIVTSGALTNVDYMFRMCHIRKINLFDTSNVTTARDMFSSARQIKEIPAFDFSSLTYAFQTFYDCWALEKVNVQGIPLATNTQSLFSGCRHLKEIQFSSLPSATNTLYLFSTCYQLESFNGACDFDVPVTTSLQNMFVDTINLERLHINAPLATAGSYAFSPNAYGLRDLKYYISGDLSSMSDNQNLFVYNTALKTLRITHNNSLLLTHQSMSGQNLDDLYNYLPTVSGKTINISNTRGRLDDNPSIATAKGWTIIG